MLSLLRGSLVLVREVVRRLGLGVMLLGLGALSACASDQTYLPALLADPMAQYEAEGIALDDTFEQPQHPGSQWRRRTHAEVQRSYRIEDQSQVEEVLEEAVEYAEAKGWRMRASDVSPDSLYMGAKELEPGDGRLFIGLSAADPLNDPDGPRVLTILLDFGSVRFDQSTTTEPGGS